MKTNRKCTCDCENVIVYIFFNKNIVSLFTPYFRVNRDSLKKTIKNEMKITEVPIFRNSRVNMDLTYLKKKNIFGPQGTTVRYGTLPYKGTIQTGGTVYIYKFFHCKASTSNTRSPLRLTVGG